MNKITIIHDDLNKVSVKYQNPISFEDLLQYLQSITLNSAKSILSKAKSEEDSEELKGYLYDMMNYAFSRTLDLFDPDSVLHPTLTEQAILEAENQIIERKFNEHTKEN